jgi:acetyl esterase/lipase
MLNALAPRVKGMRRGSMKWVSLCIAVLALLGTTLGFASHWSLLGLLNRLDGLYGASTVTLAERGLPFGKEDRLKLNIWRPKGDVQRAPVLIFFYGGSWNSGNRDFYDFYGRALAEQGFVVVVPDYRLVPEVRFPAFLEDAAAAVAWTRQNIVRYGGDPTRMSLSGHSAGAHIAAMLTLDPQWLAKAGVPSGTIRAFVGLAGPYDFFPFTTNAARAAFGHEPDPRVTQPIHFVRKDAPPILLLTGSDDTTVKPRNARALSAALSKAGAGTPFISYDGIDHSEIIQSFARPFRDKSPALEDTVKFLRAHSQPLDKSATPQ